MKYFYTATLAALTIMLMPSVSFAQRGFLGDGSGGEIGVALVTVLNFINNILIPFLFGIAFIIFIWGLFKFFIQGGADDDERSKGKTYILYALAFFVIVLAFWGIVNILVSGIGLQDEELQFIPDATPAGLPEA